MVTLGMVNLAPSKVLPEIAVILGGEGANGVYDGVVAETSLEIAWFLFTFRINMTNTEDIYIYTYIHTYIHTYIYIYIHICIHTHLYHFVSHFQTLRVFLLEWFLHDLAKN